MAPPHRLKVGSKDLIKTGERFSQKLARSHYENFSVGSFLLPARVRQDLFNIYAFCRLADDLADETVEGVSSFERLADWERRLDACATGATDPDDTIFLALGRTIRRHNLPSQPFRDLLTAFRQDLTKSRYATWDELLEYAHYSANPVGRLVLAVCDSNDESFFAHSDKICMALQLANHWQDVASDFRRGRIYVPEEHLERFEVSEMDIASGKATKAFRTMMKYLVAQTEELFQESRPLLGAVAPILKPQLYLYWNGGMAALAAIKVADYDVFGHHCKVQTADRFRIGIGAFLRWASAGVGLR